MKSKTKSSLTLKVALTSYGTRGWWIPYYPEMLILYVIFIHFNITNAAEDNVRVVIHIDQVYDRFPVIPTE